MAEVDQQSGVLGDDRWRSLENTVTGDGCLAQVSRRESHSVTHINSVSPIDLSPPLLIHASEIAALSLGCNVC